MTHGENSISLDVGIVVIGRDEGERLRRCLLSVRHSASTIIYVDSGSTDTSVAVASALGARVVELDMSHPFTAGRARNEGFAFLKGMVAQVAYIQFVDGDCEVERSWMACAKTFLDTHVDVAAVCGRRRERFPDQSLYNRLCDFEWDTPVGEARSFGGDVMMRVDAFEQVGGYRSDLIAGEEPELCVRLRANGWRIWRLDDPMTLHDANITRFSQWWRRSLRAGYAFANGAHLHGAPPARHWVRETRSALFWGLLLPLTIIASSAVLGAWTLVLSFVYPAQMLRLFVVTTGSPKARALRAGFLVLGKFPESLGVLKFLARRRDGGTPKLIEYK